MQSLSEIIMFGGGVIMMIMGSGGHVTGRRDTHLAESWIISHFTDSSEQTGRGWGRSDLQDSTEVCWEKGRGQ